MEKRNKITVIGHKNPDTDSICSAIAYAALKNKISPENIYTAARCGEISKETSFVLKTFGLAEPRYIADVRSQVSDIEIKKVDGVSGDISLKEAYNIMKKQNAVTLAVTNADGGIDGLITIGDIAASDMDVYDNRICLLYTSSPFNLAKCFITASTASACFKSAGVFVYSPSSSHASDLVMVLSICIPSENDMFSIF